MNVYDNIVLPIKLDGVRPDEAYVEQILLSLGLMEKRNAMPNQLSGGQQQRVALARALAAKPALILADEPTGNLDSHTSMDVLGLMKTSGERFGQTIVMITHNNEIAQMASRIIRLEDEESAVSADTLPEKRKPCAKTEGRESSCLKYPTERLRAKIASTTYKANGKRNLLAIFALFLTTFLISVIIALGVGYWDDDRTAADSHGRDGLRCGADRTCPKTGRDHPGDDEVKYAGVAVKCAIVNTYEDKKLIRCAYTAG